MRHYNIPIFVPHRGCPHDCAFCNQKQITAAQAEPDAVQTKQIIEQALETIPQDGEVEVAFFGGSFTGIRVETQRALLGAVAALPGSKGACRESCLSTAPTILMKKFCKCCRNIMSQALNWACSPCVTRCCKKTDADIRHSKYGQPAA